MGLFRQKNGSSREKTNYAFFAPHGPPGHGHGPGSAGTVRTASAPSAGPEPAPVAARPAARTLPAGGMSCSVCGWPATLRSRAVSTAEPRGR